MLLGVLPRGKNARRLRLPLTATRQAQNPPKPTKTALPSHLLLQNRALLTFCVIARAVLVAHHGTLFESHSRDSVDTPRVRERPKKLKIDSEVTKRVRK